MKLTLWQRLSLAFAVLLLASCAASAWLQIQANRQHEQEVTQRLSYNLAKHIAEHAPFVSDRGIDQGSLNKLFDMLMVVNPSIEVYLLDTDGRIKAHLAPPGHIKRERVAMEPIRRFLAGQPLPIEGDDPRNASQRNVFSAAPLTVGSRTVGYVYVVLLGETHAALSADVGANSVLRTTLWSMAVVAVLGLLAGLATFGWITRPLRSLTSAVRTLEKDGVEAAHAALGPEPADQHARRDEIGLLQDAFRHMTARISQQWRDLVKQDQQRRELVANISHDLRTPLTALHGYLETLSVKSAHLSEIDRRRYLDIALGQSRKVGRLAQELFELARLEYGDIKADKEPLSLADLTQDVFQKFELTAQSRQVRLDADIAPDLPRVLADVGMIERVLTNLLDNALRHSPAGSAVKVALRTQHEKVLVTVSDEGSGVTSALKSTLFIRPSAFSPAINSEHGGLGLLIVQRILQLHDSKVELLDSQTGGATFCFALGA